MFDDLMSAVALTGIAGLLAVAVSTAVWELSRPVQDSTALQAAELTTTADAAATAGQAGAAADRMPSTSCGASSSPVSAPATAMCLQAARRTQPTPTAGNRLPTVATR